jgi:hypothetical protein
VNIRLYALLGSSIVLVDWLTEAWYFTTPLKMIRY